ncbi:MAG: hypothetical protein AAF677_16750, partial [Pseudomonadota bacterium]
PGPEPAGQPGHRSLFRDAGRATHAHAASGHAAPLGAPHGAPLGAPHAAPSETAVAQPVPAKPAAPVDAIERSAARAPSPDEIRARAQRVREAIAHAQHDKAARPTHGFDDDDLPTGIGLAGGAVEADPLSAAPAPRPAPAAESGRTAGSSVPATAEERSSTLFTINRLINRMAGGSIGRAEAQPARHEPRYNPRDGRFGADDDDEMAEMPAFLRKQAN